MMMKTKCIDQVRAVWHSQILFTCQGAGTRGFFHREVDSGRFFFCSGALEVQIKELYVKLDRLKANISTDNDSKKVPQKLTTVPAASASNLTRVCLWCHVNGID